MKQIFSVCISLLLVIPTVVVAQVKLTPVSSEISFKIKNAGITVTGRFSGLKAYLAFSPGNLSTSSLYATVDVATIKTGINKRDEDLKAEKYFDAGKYKTIEIKSVKIYKKGTQYAGLFNVTIKGVTKQVEIPFEYNSTGKDAEFKGGFSINRRDYGVGEETLTMSDNLEISIEVKSNAQ